MKKLFSSFLACIMILSCCGSALATDTEPYASLSLASTHATASTGQNSGEVRINFSATASKSASLIGASIITIYKSNGTYVTTIYGSTSNGLMASGVSRKTGSPGTSYYAVVSLGATAGGESDSRNITTNVARAK